MDKEEDSKGKLLDLLLQAGLPPFELDKNGYPIPGKVVKYYREQMKYIDPIDEKQKYWTQADLAKRLGISELMVRLMETQNKGLDSIERRRALAAILKIPPTLLGLASLDDLIEKLEANRPDLMAVPDVISKKGMTNNAIGLYKDAFSIYNTMQSQRTAQKSVSEIEYWIARIRQDTRDAKRNEMKETLYLLWEFHRLAAQIYSDDICNWHNAQKHLNECLKIGGELNDANLQAIDLNRLCTVQLLQGNVPTAKIDIDAALAQMKNASIVVKCSVLANAARTYALSARDLGEITSANRFLEQSQKLVKEASKSDERYIPVGVDVVKCLFKQADSFRILGNTPRSMDTLEYIEENTISIRRIALLNLNRAECYTKLKHPEYDTALEFLIDAFNIYKDAKSIHNIGEIEKTYGKIATSLYGNAPEVIDLGIALRDLKLKKMR